MSLEIRLNDRYAQVELVSQDDNTVKLMIDDQLREVDIVEVEPGVYSILMDGQCFVIELMEGETSKKYTASTGQRSFELEVIDAETRYLMSRKGSEFDEDEKQISSPMPGKVVKIPVKEGEKVVAGQTVIIVSAMKMESEYKAGNDGVVSKIHVKEGDTIEGNQPLVTLE